MRSVPVGNAELNTIQILLNCDPNVIWVHAHTHIFLQLEGVWEMFLPTWYMESEINNSISSVSLVFYNVCLLNVIATFN